MDKNRIHTTATAWRRQRQIEDCLFENMQHTPYASISVAELCRQVGISRKAFYSYYRDKDACLHSLVERFSQESMLHVAQTVEKDASQLALATVYMEYWREQKIFFDVIVRNGLIHFLIMQAVRYVLTEEKTFLGILNTPEVKSDGDILGCYMSMQFTLLLQWYLRGFDTPPEEMARKLLRLIHRPMIASGKE